MGFPSGHVAVAAALATAAAPYLPRRYRRLLWVEVLLVAVARVYVGAHLPLDTLAGAALGWTIASAVHLVWGAPGGRPTLAAVRRGLTDLGLPVSTIQVMSADARGSTPFLVSDDAGRLLFAKVVGQQQRDADWLFRAWRYLFYRRSGDEAPFGTPKQLVEHEACLSLLASRAGVRTPALVTVGVLADGSGVVVYEHVRGEALGAGGAAVGDDVLDDIWHQEERLHGAHIAHRDLRRANILIDGTSKPWIIDFGFAEAAAARRILDQDTTELLASVATVAGSERTVTSARRVLSSDALSGALPLLQPLALSTATREDLRSHQGLLADLRQRLTTSLGLETEPELEPMTRIQPKTSLAILATIGVVYFVIPQAAELPKTVAALRTAQWIWLLPAVVASAATYLMAAVGTTAAAGGRVPLGRTVLAQLASSVANRVSPGGSGAVATIARYLERSGLSRAEAGSAVTLTTAAGGVVHVTALGVVAALLARQGIHAVHHVPSRSVVLLVVICVAVLAGLLFWSPAGRRKVLPKIREGAQSLRAVLHRPAQATKVFAGAVGVTFSYILALYFSLRAFGAHPSMLTVAAAYLFGSAIGSASTAPGGLGATEAAIVAGLIRLRVAEGQAITGVLTFRFITYWLPLLPGGVALRLLQRDGVL